MSVHRVPRIPVALILALPFAGLPGTLLAQESPYFVTYDHHLEEPGNLEVALWSTSGIPRGDQKRYLAPYLELEYGVLARWTAELYLEGQTTEGDSAIFTGWRLENRFRPLKREHALNPVLYLEYENLNEGSRIQKEVVGHAEITDETNSELKENSAHELEFKLILSSSLHDWNISENLMAEKNLSEDEGIEFGYALGVSRPLALLASAEECRFCPENFSAGLELYGGLGSTEEFGFSDTAQYLAPVISWQATDNSILRFSTAFGLTDDSSRYLLRFGYSYEFRGLGGGARRASAGRRGE
jgi:hypothetical protein